MPFRTMKVKCESENCHGGCCLKNASDSVSHQSFEVNILIRPRGEKVRVALLELVQVVVLLT